MWKRLFPLLIPCLLLTIDLSSAQESKPKKLIRIGVTQTVSYPDFDEDAKGFEKALADAGFKEGTQVIYDRQNAQGMISHARTIAQRFLNSKVDLIHSIATLSSREAVRMTQDIPIIFSSVTDPVGSEIIPKMSPPGNQFWTNVTGVSDRWPVFLQFEMYSKFFPKAKKWGTIYHPGDSRSLLYLNEMREAAKKLGLELIESTIFRREEILQATRSLARKAQVIHITFDAMAISSFDTIVKVCNEKKLPLFGGDLRCVLKGAMAAYGWDYFQIGHAAGRKAVQVLRGEKPGNIPWELGERLLLMINENAAKAQGAIVPPELLKKADKVITE